MKTHDELRDIYGTVYVQGQKYFLLDNAPTWKKPTWMRDGTLMWEVAADDSYSLERVESVELGDAGDYQAVYTASYIIFDSTALIDLLPVPVTKKVIRFYVTDDEEA